MPWSSRTVIEARQHFVMLATAPGANIRALCRQFEVSPKTAYKFLARVRTMGSQGYQDLSRRPHRSARRTPDTVERDILSVRAGQPQWGGRRIARELRQRGLTKVPAPSTITTVLARNRAPVSESAISTIAAFPAAQPQALVTTWSARLPQVTEEADLQSIFKHLLSERILDRRRAMVLLAHWLGIRQSFLCRLIGISPVTWRRCLRVYTECGADALFAPRRCARRKFDNEEIRSALFETLHRVRIRHQSHHMESCRSQSRAYGKRAAGGRGPCPQDHPIIRLQMAESPHRADLE
ncbi:helix-turn-helix domain-containing protein [Bradyrhizobium sp. USDA 4451]